jgi:rare lipoprotein A (peptidoglycan hydrolase)
MGTRMGMARQAGWLATAMLLAACGAEKSSPPVERQVVETRPAPPPAPPPPSPPVDKVVKTITGKAIWYGGAWHGKKTSSGERFDKEALTAAHRSLPFGTRVRVTNLANDHQVVVRINDRGPFGSDRRRIIDVSEAAARELDFAGHGEIRVRLEVLADAAPE